MKLFLLKTEISFANNFYCMKISQSDSFVEAHYCLFVIGKKQKLYSLNNPKMTHLMSCSTSQPDLLSMVSGVVLVSWQFSFVKRLLLLASSRYTSDSKWPFTWANSQKWYHIPVMQTSLLSFMNV